MSQKKADERASSEGYIEPERTDKGDCTDRSLRRAPFPASGAISESPGVNRSGRRGCENRLEPSH